MKLKTIDIKGKEYVTVSERIKAFWKLYPDGRINTSLMNYNDDFCLFKTEVYKDRQNVCPDATGYAHEKESSSYINKTSYIENCETSSIGRALGILGIGIDTDIASAEEVGNALYMQSTKIDKNKVVALNMSIKNNNIDSNTVDAILESFNYKTIEDIKICDYPVIVKALKDSKK